MKIMDEYVEKHLKALKELAGKINNYSQDQYKLLCESFKDNVGKDVAGRNLRKNLALEFERKANALLDIKGFISLLDN